MGISPIIKINNTLSGLTDTSINNINYGDALMFNGNIWTNSGSTGISGTDGTSGSSGTDGTSGSSGFFNGTDGLGISSFWWSGSTVQVDIDEDTLNFSGDTIYTDNVYYNTLGYDLKDRNILSGNTIDWSLGSIWTKTLTTGTTLTFSNLQENKQITLIITGEYSLTFPGITNIMNGVYDGSVSNFIQLYCVNSSAQEVWCSINQEI